MSAVRWFRGSTTELMNALPALRLLFKTVSRGKLHLEHADGDRRQVEAWRAGAGPNWVIGDPEDLRRLWDSAALDTMPGGRPHYGT